MISIVIAIFSSMGVTKSANQLHRRKQVSVRIQYETTGLESL